MDITVLHNSILFKGFDDTEISELLKALNAAEKKYNKGEMIFSSGEITDKLCFVTAGGVTIESNDMWGNRTILNLVGKGQFFAESYALLPDVPMLVDVCAAEDCSIVFLSMKSLADLNDTIRARLLANLLTITTRKNLHLSSRSYCSETGAWTYYGVS